ncbi:DUF429 domain-containing protein [Halobacillus kuroshimensis]|uniref:DUF429 domain-containing protein n=1 Tax=Halobacillus kuroshimensis TaxID=302481 RepID=UPI0004279ACF|nr:DUF429 domain-containing protein [Halobacillus kuroshimensis]
MYYAGIDLSGPSNHADTAVIIFEDRKHALIFKEKVTPASDGDIIDTLSRLASEQQVVVGIDAPLSYEDGGGDRMRDRSLRQFLMEKGGRSSSIMTPTMTRMVYLTMRGIRLSRELSHLGTPYDIQVVEVHPGAAILTRAGEADHFLSYKKDRSTRREVLDWLRDQMNMLHIPEESLDHVHTLDACAAALAAWSWNDSELASTWIYQAEPPLHPYDFCC